MKMLKINKKSIKDLFPENNNKSFKLAANISPAGDQIKAIKELTTNINKKEHNQCCLRLSRLM